METKPEKLRKKVKSKKMQQKTVEDRETQSGMMESRETQIGIRPKAP